MLKPTPIDRAEIWSVSLSYKEPIEWTTGGVETHAEYLVARIWDRDGREGAAEAVCRPSWNSMSQAGLLALFADIGWPLLSSRGLAPQDLGKIRNVGALSAWLDNLLVDLEGDVKSAAPAVISGPATAVVTRGDPHDMAEATLSAAARGFGAVKIKLGQGVERDMAVLDTVRSAVGKDFALCGDANGAYGVSECAALLRLAAQYELTFVEDPCTLAPLATSFEQMERSAVPVVVDRFCDSPLTARQFLDLGQFDIAAKPGRCGGWAAGEMIQAAAARGGHAVIGLFGESDIGALAQLRLAARADGAAIWGIEASFHDALTENVLGFDLALSDGCYVAPPTLHLASAIDWKRVETLSSSTLVLGK